MSETARYLVTLADVKDPETSWVKITTITMVSKFSQDIDLKKLEKRMNKIGPISFFKPKDHGVPSVNLFKVVRERYIDENGDPGTKSRRVKIGTLNAFEWVVKQTEFRNQLSLCYLDQFSNKSVKIFPNGSIQVAGCSSLSDCARVLKQLRCILSTVLELEGLTYSDPRIAMINTNFSLNYNVNLMETVASFGKSKKFSVEFNPDRYSAVKITFKPGEDMKRVTVSIFSTGKTIITGAETLKEIVFAYKTIIEHVNLHAKKIKVGKTATSDTFDFIEGWNVNEAVAYFKKQGVKPFEINQELVDVQPPRGMIEAETRVALTPEELEAAKRRYLPTEEDQRRFRQMFHDQIENGYLIGF